MAKPCGVPTVGDARKPRYVTSGWKGLPAVSPLNTLGTVRFKASGTLSAFDGSKSWGVSVWVGDGTLSRSITPGSLGAGGAGACAGACSVVRAGAGRVVRRVPDGTGVVAMTRTSGSVVGSCGVVGSCARAAPASAARLTELDNKNRQLRMKVVRPPQAPYILAPGTTLVPDSILSAVLCRSHGLVLQSRPGSFGKMPATIGR